MRPVSALLAEVADEEVIEDGVAEVDAQVESAPVPATVAEVPQQKVVVAARL